MDNQVFEVLRTSPGIFALVCGLLGAIVGSFLNVVILRLPRRLEYFWKRDSAELLGQPFALAEPPDLVHRASCCTQCGARIRPWHNLPVLGWLWLRGRCADCKAPISMQYPAVELTTGLLSAAVAVHFGFSFAGAAALLLTWMLVALSGIDLRERLLPDVITLPLLWLGLLIALVAAPFAGLASAVTGAMAGYLSLWSVFQLFRLLTGKEGMGYGDFKLFAALGGWLGWEKLPLIILLASMAGALTGIVLMLTKKLAADRALPFGPFLAAAGWIALLWGDALLAGYLQLFRF